MHTSTLYFLENIGMKRLLSCSLAATTLLIITASFAQARDSFVPREGDIVFHQSKSSQSKVIKAVTGSRYTHMGIVVHVEGEPMVLEAISKVSLTPYKKWVARGVDAHVVVKRLDETHRLDTTKLEAMREVGLAFEGTSYDLKFLWSDDTMYCSELVWKIYKRGAEITLSTPERYSDFDLSNPRVKKLIKARFGEKPLPLEEKVVSPVAIFESDLLITVFETP